MINIFSLCSHTHTCCLCQAWIETRCSRFLVSGIEGFCLACFSNWCCVLAIHTDHTHTHAELSSGQMRAEQHVASGVNFHCVCLWRSGLHTYVVISAVDTSCEVIFLFSDCNSFGRSKQQDFFISFRKWSWCRFKWFHTLHKLHMSLGLGLGIGSQYLLSVNRNNLFVVCLCSQPITVKHSI